MDVRLDFALRRHSTAFMILTAYLFRKKQGGRWAMLIITALFYLLSIEPVSDSLIRPLETAYDQPSLESLDGDVIIVLGGGSRAGVPDVDASVRSEVRRPTGS
mgnify:CR=1 FL=1